MVQCLLITVTAVRMFGVLTAELTFRLPHLRMWCDNRCQLKLQLIRKKHSWFHFQAVICCGSYRLLPAEDLWLKIITMKQSE